MANSFHIFSEHDFGDVTRSLFEKVKQQIYSETKDYLLNVNRAEYLQHIVSEFTLSPLGLNFEQTSISTYERLIPAERFPPTFGVFRGESYPKQVIKYHLPFSGDERSLHYVPNPRFLNSYLITVERGEVCFEVVDFYGDPERIKREAEA